MIHFIRILVLLGVFLLLKTLISKFKKGLLKHRKQFNAIFLLIGIIGVIVNITV